MALLDNILGFWNLDESSGDAADSSGNGYTLTNTNVTYSGGGANFDATTDKLENSNTAFDFQPTTAFSVSIWVDLVSVGSNQMMVTNQQEGGDFVGWSIFQGASGEVNFAMATDLSPVLYLNVKTPSSTLGTSLTHILYTKSTSAAASGSKIYVNGTNQTLTVTFDTLSGTVSYVSDFRLGNRGNSYNMNGLLRNIGVWTRELTSGEATTLYNSGTPLTYAQMSGGGGAVASTLMMQGVGG